MPVRDYVLTAFIFAILPVCLTRPWLGVIAWYWLGLMNPHRQTWDFAYTMPFGMLIGGATLLGALTAKDRKPIPWNRQLVLMVVLMLYFTVTTLLCLGPKLRLGAMGEGVQDRPDDSGGDHVHLRV